MTRPLTVTNATVWNGERFERRDLYMSDVILNKPARNALTVDLSGYTISPGKINAHDHLELNHFPRTKFRERYDNAHQWGEEVSARLNDEPFKTLRSYPLTDRLLVGALKNLLEGVTTVLHHNPPHKPLFRKDFPVRVIRKYGWAHSLHFNTDAEIVASYRKTPPNVPWCIHLAEGTDEIAAGEYQRLKRLGCVGSNTVIVHGVGMTDEDIADAAPRVLGLVVCPSTNLFLLGKTIDVSKWLAAGGRVALGTDSRLTADGGWQREFESLHDSARAALPPAAIVQIANQGAARMLNVGNTLQPGDPADWTASQEMLPPDVVVVRGVPQVIRYDAMPRFEGIPTVPAHYRGVRTFLHRDLAHQVARCSLQEPGLELLDNPQGRKRALW